MVFSTLIVSLVVSLENKCNIDVGTDLLIPTNLLVGIIFKLPLDVQFKDTIDGSVLVVRS